MLRHFRRFYIHKFTVKDNLRSFWDNFTERKMSQYIVAFTLLFVVFAVAIADPVQRNIFILYSFLFVLNINE